MSAVPDPGHCDLCIEIPHGMEGHERLDLVVESASHGKFGSPMYRCQACGAAWKRRYEGSGLFIWRRHDDAE